MIRNLRTRALLLAVAVCVSSACAQSDFSTIDPIVNKAVDDHQLPGAVVVVGHDGQVVFRHSYGMRSLEPTQEPMTADTIFDMASLTKPLAKPAKPGPEWNTMVITIDGPHTVVEVNGVKVTDYHEGDPVPPRKFDFEPQVGPRPNEGYFGLQNHSKNDVVFFEEVSIQPLP